MLKNKFIQCSLAWDRAEQDRAGQGRTVIGGSPQKPFSVQGFNLIKATVVVVLPAAHSTELMSRVFMLSALIHNL
jgi:hypothetical protein